jgi:hypothetical protein
MLLPAGEDKPPDPKHLGPVRSSADGAVEGGAARPHRVVLDELKTIAGLASAGR